MSDTSSLKLDRAARRRELRYHRDGLAPGEFYDIADAVAMINGQWSPTLGADDVQTLIMNALVSMGATDDELQTVAHYTRNQIARSKGATLKINTAAAVLIDERVLEELPDTLVETYDEILNRAGSKQPASSPATA